MGGTPKWTADYSKYSIPPSMGGTPKWTADYSKYSFPPSMGETQFYSIVKKKGKSTPHGL